MKKQLLRLFSAAAAVLISVSAVPFSTVVQAADEALIRFYDEETDSYLYKAWAGMEDGFDVFEVVGSVEFLGDIDRDAELDHQDLELLTQGLKFDFPDYTRTDGNQFFAHYISAALDLSNQRATNQTLGHELGHSFGLIDQYT